VCAIRPDGSISSGLVPRPQPFRFDSPRRRETTRRPRTWPRRCKEDPPTGGRGRVGRGVVPGQDPALREAVKTLLAGWRLWHPINPGRPEAALVKLPRIGPRARGSGHRLSRRAAGSARAGPGHCSPAPPSPVPDVFTGLLLGDIRPEDDGDAPHEHERRKKSGVPRHVDGVVRTASSPSSRRRPRNAAHRVHTTENGCGRSHTAAWVRARLCPGRS
jgi:hypothetical protein